jgi:hydrogenase assembly chaperone HypC/HupF
MCLGIPGKVLTVEGSIATVDFFGVRRQVGLDIVDERVSEGDYVMNHVGFAIRPIPAEEVGETLALDKILLREASREIRSSKSSPQSVDFRRRRTDMDEDRRQALRIELSRSNQEYWKWDECKWGTHRVNCLPGGCPFWVYSRDGRVIREEISCTYPNFSDSRFTVPDFNPRGCQKGQQHLRAMYGPDRVLHPMKRSGGDPEQFYAIDSGSGELAPLPKGTLHASCDYALEGRLSVTLADGASVELTTVFALLKRRLEDYTPDKVHEISGIHPAVLEQVAELCKPPRKVYVFINWQAAKTYHGDLIERSYCYMLALTGNVGKPGTGTQGWSGGAEFGCGMPMVSGLPKEILESADPILFAMNITGKLIEDYKMRFKMDPSMPLVEAAFGALREQLRANGTYATPIFLWYYHGGYKEVWDRYLEDPNSTKKISEYVEEALREGWWKGFDRPARDLTPRATFVSGGNPLRHYRGGMNTYLKTQWPRYELIVTIDPRWSVTALYSDYVLPAASYYEYADAKGGATSTRFGIFTDQSVPMVGESRSDRQIVLGVLRAVQASFKKRGISKYKSGDREIDVDDLYWRATYGGHYGESNEDEERLVDHAYRALGQMGWYASLDGEEVSLDNARRNGMVWLAGRPDFPTVMAQSADLVPGEVFWPLRDQVERKIPYPTTTRRIEFYLDHPWFIEADEHLVRYKIPPFIGGRQPLRLTSGHVRWSIHGVWHTAEEMLKLHRGEPFAFINSSIAAERGIENGDFIRVFNDYGEFVVRAKPTGCVRPDQLVIYHAWEPYQYKNGMSYDGLLPGPPKGIHFAGGYRHFEYSLMTWTPSQSDRHTNIQFERAELQA